MQYTGSQIVVRVIALWLTVTLILGGLSFFAGMGPLLNAFGGFYGGVIGTVSTIVGFYFIYNAYETAKRESSLALINKLYTELVQDIESIQYRKKHKGVIGLFQKEELYQGLDALYNYDADDGISPNSVLNHLNTIVISFAHLVRVASEHDYQSADVKNTIIDKIYLLYYAKIFWPFYNYKYNYVRKSILTKEWGNAEYLLFEFERLAKDTIKYLISRKIFEERVATPKDPEDAHIIDIDAIVAYNYTSHAEWLDLAKEHARLYKDRSAFRNFVGPIAKAVLPTVLYDKARHTIPA